MAPSKQKQQDQDSAGVPKATLAEARKVSDDDGDRELTRAEMSTRAVVDDPKTQAAQVTHPNNVADSVVLGQTLEAGKDKEIEVSVRDRAVVVTLGSESIKFDRHTVHGLALAMNKAATEIA